MTPPYAHLPEPVINAMPTLSDKAVRVAVALGIFMDGAGECFPSREQIMQKSGLACPYSVTLGVRELKAAGVLAVRRRRNNSSLYKWAEGRPNRLSGKSAKPIFRKNKGISRKVGDTDQSVKPTAGKSVSPTPNIPTEHTHLTAPASPKAQRPARRQRGASTGAGKPNVWAWWIGANREAGRDDPLKIGPDLGAAKTLGKLVTSGELAEEDLRGFIEFYLADRDAWLLKQGHPLRHLPGRIGAYRNRVTEQDPPPLDPDFVSQIEAHAAAIGAAKQ